MLDEKLNSSNKNGIWFKLYKNIYTEKKMKRNRSKYQQYLSLSFKLWEILINLFMVFNIYQIFYNEHSISSIIRKKIYIGTKCIASTSWLLLLISSLELEKEVYFWWNNVDITFFYLLPLIWKEGLSMDKYPLWKWQRSDYRHPFFHSSAKFKNITVILPKVKSSFPILEELNKKLFILE